MKKILTYNEAFDKLEKIVGQLEGNDIPLDKLAEKVTEANELVVFCENQLKNIENQLPKQSGH
ncbi:MAG: exodeoxyribonuclease VII small subunit [Cyclobacteriaceae bacterium]|nr:exodeoxyribonuclease VII small subunit [Cytophagales bacterium]HNP77363.1 exodeoxyribonuclease VII small subunit [Cyclobacteriaceae bacterium]